MSEQGSRGAHAVACRDVQLRCRSNASSGLRSRKSIIRQSRTRTPRIRSSQSDGRQTTLGIVRTDGYAASALTVVQPGAESPPNQEALEAARGSQTALAQHPEQLSPPLLLTLGTVHR